MLALVCWWGWGWKTVSGNSPGTDTKWDYVFWCVRFEEMWKEAHLVRMILNVKSALHLVEKEAGELPCPHGGSCDVQSTKHIQLQQADINLQSNAWLKPLWFYSQDKDSSAMPVIRCCTIWLFSLLPPCPLHLGSNERGLPCPLMCHGPTGAAWTLSDAHTFVFSHNLSLIPRLILNCLLDMCVLIANQHLRSELSVLGLLPWSKVRQIFMASPLFSRWY